MLKKIYRLRKNDDFRRVYRHKKSVATPNLVLYYKKAANPSQKRIGFSLSKKIGKAHTRNLYKRRLREISRKHLTRIEDGYDFIFVARSPIVTLNYKELEKNVLYLLKKSGVYKNA